MMDDLKHELNIIPHSYQGKDGAFAGPECAKFLNNLESLSLLNSSQGVPISPKLHVMAVHLEEWLDTHSRGMGDDSEQAVEASHGRFSKLWESYQVRDEALFETNIYKT
jgi:hypothetical protein